MLWICLWNLQEGPNKGVSRYEAFTGCRPSVDAGAQPGTFGDCYITNRKKEERKGGHFETAHGDVVMYLGPNGQSKDCHYFYNPKTDRYISRRSFERVAGIPHEWLQGKSDIGLVIDENGNKWDFVNGPQQYDVWHLGATSEAVEAVARDREPKFPLHKNLLIDYVSSTNDIVNKIPQVISTGQEVTALLDDTSDQLGPLEVQPSETISKTIPEEISSEDVSSRTRSSGPADDLSIKQIKYKSSFHLYNDFTFNGIIYFF